MVKKLENHRQPWTAGQVRELRNLAKENTPTRVMGLKLGRTPEAVQTRANAEGISLKPTNQRPNKRGKS